MLNAFVLSVTIFMTTGGSKTSPTSTSYVQYFHDLEACEAAEAKAKDGVFVRTPNSVAKIPAIYAAYQTSCAAKATAE